MVIKKTLVFFLIFIQAVQADNLEAIEKLKKLGYADQHPLMVKAKNGEDVSGYIPGVMPPEIKENPFKDIDKVSLKITPHSLRANKKKKIIRDDIFGYLVKQKLMNFIKCIHIEDRYIIVDLKKGTFKKVYPHIMKTGEFRCQLLVNQK